MIPALPHHRQALAQGDGLTVEVQQRIGVALLGRHVDGVVVGVHIEPGLARGKARVGGIVPLHGGAGAVPAADPQPPQPHLLRQVGHEVAALDILIHIRVDGPPVGHADLLPLINEWCTLLEEIRRRQRLAALGAVFLAAVAGDNAGVVMVFQIQHVPRLAPQLPLPQIPHPLQPPQGEGCVGIVGIQTVGAHALELDHHIHLAVLLVDVFQGLTGADHRGLRQRHAVIVIQHVPLELLQILMDPRAVVIVADAPRRRHQPVVRQAVLLGDEGDHILPEAVHPQIQPEPQDVLYLLPHQRVIHVQIRLLHGEQVQVVLLPQLVPLPRFPLEHAVPVVGQVAAGLLLPPDVVIGVGRDAAAGLLEPLVLVAGMVHHQIHNDLHTSLMGALQHLFEPLHAAELRRDIPVIGDIVPAVRARRGIQRRKPDAVHPQTFDVVQLFVHTLQVAHTVAVAVLEAARPDLIEHHVLIPAVTSHLLHPFS